MSRRFTSLLAACLAISGLHAQAQPTQAQATQTRSARADTSEQKRANRFSSDTWCEDDLTVCFGSRSRRAFSGVRIIFEPQLGVLFQSGENRLENTSFRALERIGVETNLSGAAISFQALLIYPSTVEFDAESPVRTWIKDGTGKVGVDYGLAAGFSFLDGIVAIGGGMLDYDQRDFTERTEAGDPRPSDALHDYFIYFNIQPISALRSALKR
jgi:hypothetical protein